MKTRMIDTPIRLNPANTRNVGIDILRFVLMAMIITHHCIVHGLGLLSLSNGYNPKLSYIFYLLNSICVTGVNGFFWISGFCHIKSHFRKIRGLYFECVFYAAVLSVITFVSGLRGLPVGYSQFGKELFDILFPVFDYWYIAAYLAISLFAPLINKGIESTSRTDDICLVIGLIASNTIYGFLFHFIGVGDGYTLVQGIYMYCIGALSRKYYPQIVRRIRTCWFMFAYCILTLVESSMAIGCTKLELWKYAWRMFSYNNPLIVCSSVALCFWFSSVKFKGGRITKAVSLIGANCLAAYLITDYTKVRSVIFQPVVAVFAGNNVVNVSLIILYAIILVVLCNLFDRFRIDLSNRLFNHNKAISS